MNKIAPEDDLIHHVKLSVGDRVRRGEDWNRGDEDKEGVGVVTEALDENGLVSVAWDQDQGSQTCKYTSDFGIVQLFLFLTHAHTRMPRELNHAGTDTATMLVDMILQSTHRPCQQEKLLERT